MQESLVSGSIEAVEPKESGQEREQEKRGAKKKSFALNFLRNAANSTLF